MLVDLAPGPYVLICVTDTGVGMNAEVLERALDPFFTTKPIGHGTGLGLSQVFGFVKQSGGHLKLYSRPGQGTTVKIYLPELQKSVEPAEVTDPLPVSKRARQETILVVEDNDDVRSFTTDTLRDFGFNVIAAVDAAEALKILDKNDRIDLLFSDIGLPGLNGRELVATVRRRLSRQHCGPRVPQQNVGKHARSERARQFKTLERESRPDGASYRPAHAAPRSISKFSSAQPARDRKLLLRRSRLRTAGIAST
jgi:CheY-like chemotaxis protein